MKHNLRSQSLTRDATVVYREPVVPHWDRSGVNLSIYLDFRKRSPIRNIARAVMNECRSNEEGDVVDDDVVVQMKSFVRQQLASQP